MTEDPLPSRRAEARTRARRRRTKAFERREAIFDLFVSGYSHHEIAKALKTSAATVSRTIDTALAERRLDAPERYIRVQMARLTKALNHADYKLGNGDIRAFAPYIKLVAAMDRYHRFDARLSPPGDDVPALPPPLALPAAEPQTEAESEPDGADAFD